MTICVPNSSCSCLVFNSTCAIAAMEAKASPRKPLVFKANKSSALRIFDVACLSKHKRASVTFIPEPLSITCTSVLPASLTINLISVAFASIAFSINSLTTEAGR